MYRTEYVHCPVDFYLQVPQIHKWHLLGTALLVLCHRLGYHHLQYNFSNAQMCNSNIPRLVSTQARTTFKNHDIVYFLP